MHGRQVREIAGDEILATIVLSDLADVPGPSSQHAGSWSAWAAFGLREPYGQGSCYRAGNWGMSRFASDLDLLFVHEKPRNEPLPRNSLTKAAEKLMRPLGG